MVGGLRWGLLGRYTFISKDYFVFVVMCRLGTLREYYGNMIREQKTADLLLFLRRRGAGPKRRPGPAPRYQILVYKNKANTQ